MKTAPTNKKVREIIGLVREGKLVPRPEFQRRLVWTPRDKDRFIETVLNGFPFPEIYVADGDVDLETGEGTQLLVDGLQRVDTLRAYFTGDPELKLPSIPPYSTLTNEEKTAFLHYDVAVRDLGAVTRPMIIEVFKRINATQYSLRDIEINNAVYAGALKQYAARLSENPFFTHHKVFTPMDYKRMGDLRYALLLIATLIGGYFNRDEAFGEVLERYNDLFPLEGEIDSRLNRVFQFIDECGFHRKSRVWKKADLFTLVVELDTRFGNEIPRLQPGVVVDSLSGFYDAVDRGEAGNGVPSIYHKAALQASNDRINRLRRGAIIGGVLEGLSPIEISERLVADGLIQVRAPELGIYE